MKVFWDLQPWIFYRSQTHEFLYLWSTVECGWHTAVSYSIDELVKSTGSLLCFSLSQAFKLCPMKMSWYSAAGSALVNTFYCPENN